MPQMTTLLAILGQVWGWKEYLNNTSAVKKIKSERGVRWYFDSSVKRAALDILAIFSFEKGKLEQWVTQEIAKKHLLNARPNCSDRPKTQHGIKIQPSVNMCVLTKAPFIPVGMESLWIARILFICSNSWWKLSVEHPWHKYELRALIMLTSNIISSGKSCRQGELRVEIEAGLRAWPVSEFNSGTRASEEKMILAFD